MSGKFDDDWCWSPGMDREDESDAFAIGECVGELTGGECFTDIYERVAKSGSDLGGNPSGIACA